MERQISCAELKCCMEISAQDGTNVRQNMELAELNGLGFNHFPNKVALLICFLGGDHNFG